MFVVVMALPISGQMAVLLTLLVAELARITLQLRFVVVTRLMNVRILGIVQNAAIQLHTILLTYSVVVATFIQRKTLVALVGRLRTTVVVVSRMTQMNYSVVDQHPFLIHQMAKAVVVLA